MARLSSHSMLLALVSIAAVLVAAHPHCGGRKSHTKTSANPTAPSTSPVHPAAPSTSPVHPTASAPGTTQGAGGGFGSTIKPGPEYVTIMMVNSHRAPVTTSHAEAAGGPPPSGGLIMPGTVAVDATAMFVVPTGWGGNVAVNEVPNELTGQETLFEANFNIPEQYNFAVFDLDTSYVNGYSLPMTCSCSGAVVAGCNVNLDLNTCPPSDLTTNNACSNPLRSDETANNATQFFKPCQGEAYTFVNDNGANSFGHCQDGSVTCCIGESCPGTRSP